jgi:hypothetical protein
MDLSARREDLVEMERAKKPVENAGSEEACSKAYAHPEDEVWPTVIDCSAAETFVDGAGI